MEPWRSALGALRAHAAGRAPATWEREERELGTTRGRRFSLARMVEGKGGRAWREGGGAVGARPTRGLPRDGEGGLVIPAIPWRGDLHAVRGGRAAGERVDGKDIQGAGPSSVGLGAGASQQQRADCVSIALRPSQRRWPLLFPGQPSFCFCPFPLLPFQNTLFCFRPARARSDCFEAWHWTVPYCLT